jgi:CTP synthase (UTP-ammonia lyase)
MGHALRIGVPGEFNPAFPGHVKIRTSLEDAARKLGIAASCEWVATPAITRENAAEVLGGFDGIWAPPGSPYENKEGMLAAIEFARTNDWPFLGTCGGCQYTLIEYARNVLGISDADTAEDDPNSKNAIVIPVSCAVPNRQPGDPKLVGASTVRLKPGSRLLAMYQRGEAQEEYFCNFEVNAAYRPRFEATGLTVSATDPDGEARAVELAGRRFFVATLYQPQRSTEPEKPHPLIVSYLDATRQFHLERKTITNQAR